MTKDELIAFLRDRLEATQAACCIHSDGIYGAVYDPNCEGELDGFEAAIEAVEGLHTMEFVAEWLDRVPAVVAHPWDVDQVKEAWEKEMGA
jgi:hypothetical protein